MPTEVVTTIPGLALLLQFEIGIEVTTIDEQQHYRIEEPLQVPMEMPAPDIDRRPFWRRYEKRSRY